MHGAELQYEERTQTIASAETPTRTIGASIARVFCFVWVLLIACPIRYWPIDDTALDNSWVFAMNWGAAHGLAFGRDLVWTTGPLSYLVFPQDVGSNLTQGLLFQSIAWLVMGGVLADLFFRSGIAVANLRCFAIFFSLSAPLYWFNYLGVENLLLATTFVLLIQYRARGNLERYILALGLIAVVGLIKLTGLLVGAVAMAGFLADSFFRAPRQAARELALALVVTPLTFAGGLLFFVPDFSSLAQFIASSIGIVAGYSSAMSLRGDPWDFAGAIEVLIGIGAFLFVKTSQERRNARFLAALLAGPLLLSAKHGFVRQDEHIINFFCFAGLALALICLLLPVGGKRGIVTFLVSLNFAVLVIEFTMPRIGLPDWAAQASGMRGAMLAIDALQFDSMRGHLKEQTAQTPKAHLSPQALSIVGKNSIASLSLKYGGLSLQGLDLKLYPVPHRYSAYTPALDRQNADWIRDRGPRFLVWDGEAIDGRHAWAETPAMWWEVYRWYDTRLLEDGNLLLERRSTPRYSRLEKTGASARVNMASAVELPSDGLFWSLRCAPTLRALAQKLLLRIPEVQMEVRDASKSQVYRVLPDLLAAPLPGRAPVTLPQFTALFDPASEASPKTTGVSIKILGPGASAYHSTCSMEIFHPTTK
jgi:hypothetical protein